MYSAADLLISPGQPWSDDPKALRFAADKVEFRGTKAQNGADTRAPQ